MQAVSVNQLFNGDALDQAAASIIMGQIYWDLVDLTNELDTALVPLDKREDGFLRRRNLVLSYSRGVCPAWVNDVAKRNLIIQTLQRRLNIYPPVVSRLERRAMDNI